MVKTVWWSSEVEDWMALTVSCWAVCPLKVTLHAPCSVLVVKQAPWLLKRVILAIDGSKSSEKTLQFLLRNMRSTYRNPSVWEK